MLKSEYLCSKHQVMLPPQSLTLWPEILKHGSEEMTWPGCPRGLSAG